MLFFAGKKKYEREYWFSVPKDKSKNLFLFFKKWFPEIYGDVDDTSGCENRGLEPLATDDEDVDDGDDEQMGDDAQDDKENDVCNSNTGGGAPVEKQKHKFWKRRSPLNFLKLVEDHFSTDGMLTDWNVIFLLVIFSIMHVFCSCSTFRYPIHRRNTVSNDSLRTMANP